MILGDRSKNCGVGVRQIKGLLNDEVEIVYTNNSTFNNS